MIIIILITLLALSVAINIILYSYASKMVRKWFVASEAISHIFTRFDAYKYHLNSIYELRQYYGDRDLKEVIEHTDFMIKFIKKFDGIFSFMQPELEEIIFAQTEEELQQEEEEQEQL